MTVLGKFRKYEDLLIGLVSVLLFTIVNLFGGVVNDTKNYYFGVKDVLSVTPLHILYGGFFVLSCRLRIKIRKSLRLPLVHVVFGTVISIPLFNGDGARQMVTGDFIDAINLPFCFFVNTIGLSLCHIKILIDINFQLFGVVILGLAIYQICVLEISTLIVRKFITCQTE